MNAVRLARGVVISLATLGMCVPQVAFAAGPAPTPVVIDVALSDGGVLHGQVVDLQGAGVAGVPVSVRAQDREMATATTAADGSFSVQGLRGGMYQVSAANGNGVYRLWSAGTAPPAAQSGATLYAQNGVVPNDAVVYTSVKTMLANPIFIAAVVATAIAVPVALANSHSASP